MKFSSSMKAASCVIATGLIVCFSQACGKFSSDPTSMNADSSANQLVIAPSGTTATVSQSLSFQATGATLSANAVYSWSHELTGADGGVSYCTETNGNTNPLYDLTCVLPGTLSVKLMVVDGSAVYGPVQVAQSVVYSTLPAASPTPTSTPNPIGVQLYQQNCAGCHQDIASTTINTPTVANIQNAIANEPSMNAVPGLTSLTVDQITSISNALQGM